MQALNSTATDLGSTRCCETRATYTGLEKLIRIVPVTYPALPHEKR
jgi:hypothetical protein